MQSPAWLRWSLILLGLFLADGGTVGYITAQQNKNKPPTVEITNPTRNSVFLAPANITIEASATDSDGTVSKVDFFSNSTLIGTDFTSPYSISWRDVGAGSYSLTATATDDKGASKKSRPLNISVQPDPRSQTGEWSSLFSWPDVAIHLHLLPNGKILSYSDDNNPNYLTNGTRLCCRTEAFIVDVLNGAPITNVFLENRTNMFCSGHMFLPDGRLLVLGGHRSPDSYGEKHVNIFDSVASQWIQEINKDMNAGRWYPSVCMLGNGDVLVLSGDDQGSAVNNTLPQVWQTNQGGGWRDLSTAQLALPLYPMIHLAPNGKVFVSGPGQVTRYLDTAGTGAWSTMPSRNFGTRSYGSSVMYDNGKVIVVGGGDPPTNTAEVIDLNATSPSWRFVGSMAYTRRQLNATLLPDGKVLVTGGTSSSGFNDATNAVLAAESWDPATEGWSTLASMAVKRVYHSTALLLPDARVLSAGGGRPKPVAGSDNYNAEIFSPPYLFKGTRPTITSAPSSVGYGQTFFVGTSDAASITSVTWTRLASVTHAFDMGQRINRLSFAQAAGGLNVTAPSIPNQCPPGHYMLFILNGSGVPSVAKIVQIL